jgi:predicted RNase H-like HicB family nuclease
LLNLIFERIIFTLRYGALILLTAILSPAEEGGYIALNPETGTTTQGETVDEAIANLKEATSLYLDEFPMQT